MASNTGGTPPCGKGRVGFLGDSRLSHKHCCLAWEAEGARPGKGPEMGWGGGHGPLEELRVAAGSAAWGGRVCGRVRGARASTVGLKGHGESWQVQQGWREEQCDQLCF